MMYKQGHYVFMAHGTPIINIAGLKALIALASISPENAMAWVSIGSRSQGLTSTLWRGEWCTGFTGPGQVLELRNW